MKKIFFLFLLWSCFSASIMAQLPGQIVTNPKIKNDMKDIESGKLKPIVCNCKDLSVKFARTAKKTGTNEYELLFEFDVTKFNCPFLISSVVMGNNIINIANAKVKTDEISSSPDGKKIRTIQFFLEMPILKPTLTEGDRIPSTVKIQMSNTICALNYHTVYYGEF